MFSIALRGSGKRCRLTGSPVPAAALDAIYLVPRRAPRQCRRASNTTWRPVSVLDDSWSLGAPLTESRLISSANYVRTELPVRIAHRLRDMQQLPYVVVTNPHINDVYNLYYNAFDCFRKLKEVKTLEDNDRLCEIIAQNLKGHLTVIPKLAMGILECGGLMDPKDLDNFMNTILRSRISRRVIAEQHLSLTETFNSPYFSPGAKLSESDFIGEIFIKCSAKEVIDRCAKAVTALARSTNGPDAAVPEIHVYIVGELLRNSVEAVIERHQKTNDPAPPPPIEVTICEAQEHVIFRISDRGGGIPREELPLSVVVQQGPPEPEATRQPRPGAPHGCHHARAPRRGRARPRRPQDTHLQQLPRLAHQPAPNLRLGMGLPLSRVYAEYWAGSLNLHSLEGYGVDAFLQISRLGNKNEQLATRASMDAV
ncbi:hypothetical protein ACCO45_008403 [Purpureocillium lilacinum]|uniref:Uncharacterized protein n=1 Tax=Purpureocillium lilacinum TaxID=33203 RepID=A0ACC4DN74_PURLI